jgi:hypothetical protein
MLDRILHHLTTINILGILSGCREEDYPGLALVMAFRMGFESRDSKHDRSETRMAKSKANLILGLLSHHYSLSVNMMTGSY